jgi:hypothetical protein
MGNIIPTLNEAGMVAWGRLSGREAVDDETAATKGMERRIGRRRGMKRRVRCDGE